MDANTDCDHMSVGGKKYRQRAKIYCTHWCRPLWRSPTASFSFRHMGSFFILWNDEKPVGRTSNQSLEYTERYHFTVLLNPTPSIPVTPFSLWIPQSHQSCWQKAYMCTVYDISYVIYCTRRRSKTATVRPENALLTMGDRIFFGKIFFNFYIYNICLRMAILLDLRISV